MTDHLLMSSQPMLPGMSASIGAAESPDGTTPSTLLGGATSPHGPSHSPASPSPQQENRKAWKTSATCGLHGSGTLESYDLAQSLASRLRERLGTDGSMEYSQTWREKATDAGRLYWAHTASAHRTSDSGCSGWPTARSTDGDKNVRTLEGSAAEIARKGTPQDLAQAAAVAGWPTPQAMDTLPPKTGDALARNKTKGGCSNLREYAQLAGWPTPQSRDGTHGGGQAKRATNPKRSNDLDDFALLAGWATPTSRDHKDGDCDLEKNPVNARLGRQSLHSSPAETGKRGALNPAFSRWLMHYPAEWCQAAIRAHRKLTTRRKGA